MSKNPRATYIPPAKRKRQNQQSGRFHGAFTGGFSAGYFNTVDTKEGWNPSTAQRREQKLEDFMDDQDHQEWGGPTNVRQEFKVEGNTSSKAEQGESPLESLLRVSRPLTVGPRLLRRLGWREGASAAFVPSSAGEEIIGATKDGREDEVSKIHLSKKRLKQIQLQSTRIKLPPPKLDQCGLGFEALEKAPEFKRYREQRQELARLRARGQSNVYRISDAVGGSEDKNVLTSGINGNIGNDYLSYETGEDFVGSRSVGGFALRDDEDDAYDSLALGSDRNTGKSSNDKLLSGEYHAEVVELDEDSDVEETPEGRMASSKKTATNREKGNLLGGLLATWAMGGSKQTAKDSSKAPNVALTSSGKPPVAGFRLGGSMESHKKRYPGPDLPREYLLKRHKFGLHEQPAIFQTIGRAIKLEGEEQARKKRHLEQQSMPPRPTTVKRNETSLAGKQFASLAAAMKNRFTSGNSDTSGESGGGLPPRMGLYQPSPVQAKPKETELNFAETIPEVANKQEIVVRRTSQAFAPLPLLCKRFGVPVPRHTFPVPIEQPDRVTEAAFFEKEVLTTARQGGPTAPVIAKNQPAEIAPEPGHQIEDDLEVPRPSVDKLKAIFEPDSGESSEDTDLDSMDDDDKAAQSISKNMLRNSMASSHGASELLSPLPAVENLELVKYQSRDLAVNEEKSDGSSDDSSRSNESSSHHRKDKRRKKSSSHHKKKKRCSSRKSRKRSRQEDDGTDSESEKDSSGQGKKRDAKERRRKDGKKRRKKHFSSRHK